MENERTQYTNRTDESINKIYNKRNKLKTAKRYQRNLRSDEISAKKQSFLFILGIILFVIFSGLLGSIQPPESMESVSTPTGSQLYIASISGDVGNIAEDSISFVLTIIEPVAKTIELIVRSFGSIVNSLLTFINWFYEPILDYDIRDTDDPTIICTSYDDLALPQKINYTSNRLWHNLWNNPNIDTNEEWHIYLQQTRYGTEAYNEVCTS
jgi:uncharacterized membrane protein (DUF485 family)